MKVIIRGEATRVHRQHPVSRFFPFCISKYRWHGSMDTYTGCEVQDIPCVLAVFIGRRKDGFGPYVRLISVILNWVQKGIQKSRAIATTGPFLTNFL